MRHLNEKLESLRVLLEPGQPYWRQCRSLVSVWEFMPVTRTNKAFIRAWSALSNVEPSVVRHLRSSLTLTGICQIVKDPKAPRGERERHVVHPDATQYINAQLLRPILGRPRPATRPPDDDPPPKRTLRTRS